MNTCVAIGSEGIDISHDEGSTWKRLSDEGYYTGRFSTDDQTLWLAGHGKLSKLNINDD